MSQLLTTLAILACPLGMGAMMWLMSRGRGGRPAAADAASSAAPGTSAELARLRAEIEQLQAAQQVSAREVETKDVR